METDKKEHGKTLHIYNILKKVINDHRSGIKKPEKNSGLQRDSNL